jgi:hypothetical protein
VAPAANNWHWAAYPYAAQLWQILFPLETVPCFLLAVGRVKIDA